MAGNYTVEQGDHLSKIAKAFGFTDYQVIWDDPQNAALKQLRETPNVLFPGDVLFVRDKEEKDEARPTDQRHKFKKKGADLKLRLILEDQFENPIANAPCVLTLGGDTLKVTTGADGKIEEDIKPDVHEGTLEIQDAQTPFDKTPLKMKIGDLDPVKQPSGQIARLNNLGYFAGDPQAPDHLRLESAVEEFQCDNGLTVDGACGPVTQGRLKKIYGC